MVIVLYLYDKDIGTYITQWDKLQGKDKENLAATKPLVSVLIPFRNEKTHLPGLISQLNIQDYPNYEVILIDDHSEDAPDEWLLHHLSTKITLTTSSGQGKKEALESGLEKAKGDYVLFTDADTQHGPGWISTMYHSLIASNGTMITGPVLGREGRDIFSKYFYLDLIGLMVVTASAVKGRLHPMANGANMMIKRDLLPEDDPFSKADSPSGDDLFMASTAFQKDQLDFCLHKEAAVTTKGPGGLTALIRQRHRWASKNSKIKSPQMERTLKHYSTLYLLLGALVVYTFLAPAWGLFLLAVAYILKSLSDLSLIRKGGQWLDRPVNLLDILQVQWINIVVHWGAGLRMALGQPIVWKKRSY